MNYRIYLDDIRNPKGDFDFIARTSNEAIRIMEANGCPEFISFDFDLGNDDRAINVVKFMINEDLDTNGEFIPENFTWYTHSANGIGKSMIDGYLRSYFASKYNTGPTETRT